MFGQPETDLQALARVAFSAKLAGDPWYQELISRLATKMELSTQEAEQGTELILMGIITKGKL